MAATAEPASQSVELRGALLHYLDWGNAGAAPLILLHGMGGAAGEWRRVAEHFQFRYHVIALDQRRHGEFDHVVESAYATDDFVGDLDALVDALASIVSSFAATRWAGTTPSPRARGILSACSARWSTTSRRRGRPTPARQRSNSPAEGSRYSRRSRSSSMPVASRARSRRTICAGSPRRSD